MDFSLIGVCDGILRAVRRCGFWLRSVMGKLVARLSLRMGGRYGRSRWAAPARHAAQREELSGAHLVRRISRGSCNSVSPAVAWRARACGIGLLPARLPRQLGYRADHPQPGPGGRDADGDTDDGVSEAEDGLLPGIVRAHGRHDHDDCRGDPGRDCVAWPADQRGH